MNLTEPIQAIAFDAYGTLFDVASVDLRLKYHFGDKSQQVANIWRRKQLEYTWLRTLMNRYKDFYSLTEDALVYACNDAGVSLTPTISQDLMEHYNQLNVYPEVAPALTNLAQQYRLAILSNANPELLQKAVAHNKIGDHLEAIISVDPLRQFKPVPSVYQLPVSHWKVSKAAVLFVSSNTWDIAGAKSFGLSVAWVVRGNKQEENLGYSPDLKVKDLKELAVQLSNNKEQ